MLLNKDTVFRIEFVVDQGYCIKDVRCCRSMILYSGWKVLLINDSVFRMEDVVNQ